MIVYKSVLSSGEGSGGGVPVDSLTITTPPTKTTYTTGDILETGGMVITATAGSLSGNVVNDCTYSPNTFPEEGAFTVTASYYGLSDTFNVLVQEEQIGTLEETSWDLIQRVASVGQGSQYWSVGDDKTVSVNGTVGNQLISGTLKVYIIGFNHDNNNGIYFQCFRRSTNSEDIVLKPTASTSYTDGTKTYNINHWGNSTYGGWKGCDMRYDILGSTDVPPSVYGANKSVNCVGYDATSTCATNPVPNTLMSALPSDLRAVMAPWTIYSDNVGSSRLETDITTSIDYLPLLSVYEEYGDSMGNFGNPYEKNFLHRFEYYVNGDKYQKYDHTTPGSKIGYLTRSVSGGAWVCTAWGGNLQTCSPSYSNAISPAFRVA